MEQMKVGSVAASGTDSVCKMPVMGSSQATLTVAIFFKSKAHLPRKKSFTADTS
jgi:hypothetical protein